MLYADLTIFFVNVVQIVAHFHIKYREKVYIFWGLIQHNEKSCTNNLNSKSFAHLFKGGGVEGWSPSSPFRNSKQSLLRNPLLSLQNGARGEKCESISRGGVGEVCFTRSLSPFYSPERTTRPKRSSGTFWTKELFTWFCELCTNQIPFSTD